MRNNSLTSKAAAALGAASLVLASPAYATNEHGPKPPPPATQPAPSASSASEAEAGITQTIKDSLNPSASSASEAEAAINVGKGALSPTSSSQSGVEIGKGALSPTASVNLAPGAIAPSAVAKSGDSISSATAKSGDLIVKEGALSPSASSTQEQELTATQNNDQRQVATQETTQQTTVSQDGNNADQRQSVDARDQSTHIFKSGAASNQAAAASHFALKACVSSLSVNLNGGGVFGVYGGIGINHTGSGAVNVTFKGPDGKDMAVTIPEMADMSATTRAYAISDLPEKGKALAMCLTSNFHAELRAQELAYQQSIGVANIQGLTATTIASINRDRDVAVTQITEAGKLANTAMTHFCALATDKHPVTIPTGGTAPANRNFPKDGGVTEHQECTDNARTALGIIKDAGTTTAVPTFATPPLSGRRAPVFTLPDPVTEAAAPAPIQ